MPSPEFEEVKVHVNNTSWRKDSDVLQFTSDELSASDAEVRNNEYDVDSE